MTYVRGDLFSENFYELLMVCEFLLNVYFTGTAGNSLEENNGMKFSTQDVDNDSAPGHCAQGLRGAWWFNYCGRAHLNGEYLGGLHNQPAEGIAWFHFKTSSYSHKVAEMKVAPHKN